MKQAWIDYSTDDGCYIRTTQTIREYSNGWFGTKHHSIPIRASVNDISNLDTLETLSKRNRARCRTIHRLTDIYSVREPKCSLKDMAEITSYQMEDDIPGSLYAESVPNTIKYSFVQIRTLASAKKVYI